MLSTAAIRMPKLKLPIGPLRTHYSIPRVSYISFAKAKLNIDTTVLISRSLAIGKPIMFVSVYVSF